jgi:hypothetical protein
MVSKFIVAILLCCLGILTLTAKELKVLMIGNSFSVCVGDNLHQIVRTNTKHHLELTSAFIGGCTLSRHASNLKKSEADINFKPYRCSLWNSSQRRNKILGNLSINELLKNNNYDIITIQQGSTQSFDYKTYQPYADELISYIRKYQKKAEIVIQQTWAYNKNSSRILPHPKARYKFDSDSMYEQLKIAYDTLAKKYNLRVIPTGDAVQLYRKYITNTYKTLDLLPKEPHIVDVVGNRHGDYIHLNQSGRYLQACLWFGFLFNEDIEKITYVPKNIDSNQGKILRQCALNALNK